MRPLNAYAPTLLVLALAPVRRVYHPYNLARLPID